MAKTKKQKDSSESDGSSEDSTSSSSSSSSDSSSTESSSSEEEIKKKKREKKVKKTKGKKRRKKSPSSSSTSSSSGSDNGTSSSSSSEDEKPKKKKEMGTKTAIKHAPDVSNDGEKQRVHEKRLEHKIARVEREDHKREASDSHNKSKWDSPNMDVEYNRRDWQRNRNREYYQDNYKNNGRQDRNWYDNRRGGRGFERRNDFRDRFNRDRGRGRNRDEDHEEENRGRERDPDRGRDSRNERPRNGNYNDRYERNRDQRDDRERWRSRSPRRPRNFPRRRSRDDGESYEWGKSDDKEKTSQQPEEREKPNFGLSGKLTEDANKVNGVVIKYAEPPEARKPKRRWRLYPFKGEKALQTLYIHRQSCYLVGRDRKVCDLPVDHPSCSKQHAALQYRLVPFERENGTVGKRVRPYIIDLESANGTFINNKKIESKKYIELLEKDVIKFGFSSREYVLLHENSKEDQQDDDITEEVEVKQEPED